MLLGETRRVSYEERQAEHDRINAEVAHLVRDGWLLDIVGGSFGSGVAVCPVCFSYVPNTNVAKVKHQEWHDALGAPGQIA